MHGRRARLLGCCLGLCLCLCLSLALGGCVHSQRLPPLSPLHLAGLQHLPGLQGIIDSGYGVGIDIAVFQSPGDAIPRAVLIDGDHLMVTNLDGSGQRQLNPAVQCEGKPAVTPDGQWAACLGAQGSAAYDHLELVSLAAGTSRHHEFQLSTAFYHSPVWSPDGTRLAVVAGCTVQVYAAGAGYASLDLIASLTSPGFTNDGACENLAVGWSPDGARLEIAAQPFQSDSLLVDDHASITAAMLAASANVTIPAAQLTTIPLGAPFPIAAAAWNPGVSDTLALSEGNRLLIYPTAAGQVGTWLTMPDSSHLLGRLTWLPDGRSLLLIVTGQSCVDSCISPLPDAYLFTPPAP